MVHMVRIGSHKDTFGAISAASREEADARLLHHARLAIEYSSHSKVIVKQLTMML